MTARSILRSSVACAAALLAAACASTSDVQRLQSQISDLQDQLVQLKRTSSTKEDVDAAISRMGDQNAALLKSNATLVAKVDQIEDKLNNGQGSQEQSNYRMDRVAQQVTQLQHDLEALRASSAAAAAAAAAPPSGASQPVPAAAMPSTMPSSSVSVTAPASEESQVGIYQIAYRDYQQGRYDLAIAGFRDFVQKNPGSDLADNAAYWIGECLYSQKKFRESIAQFDRVVTDYPKSEKVPSALLKKGYAYISIGNKAQGIVQLQYVVHEHPEAPEAAKAREELKKLGVESR